MSQVVINHALYLGPDQLYWDEEKNLDLRGATLTERLDFIYENQIKSYPKYYRMDGMAKLVFILGELMCQRSNICEETEGSEIAFVMLNASGSYPSDSIHGDLIRKGFDRSSPANFVYTLPNVGMGEVCIKQKITGEGMFLIEEKFSATRIWDLANLFLTQRKCKAILIGWAEPTQNDGNCIFLMTERDSGLNRLNTEQNILKLCNNE